MDSSNVSIAFPRAAVSKSLTRFRWAFVALLCAVGFVLFVSRTNMTVAGRYIRDDFGFSQGALGSIFGAFLFGYAFALLPSGWLADRYGPRRVLLVAISLWAALTLLTGMIHSEMFGIALNSAAVLTAMRFILGVCQACAFPTFARATANWMRKDERGKTMGLVQAAAVLGGAATPLMVQPLIMIWGWRESFFVTGALTFAVALSWSRIATDRPDQHPLVSPEELDLITSAAVETHRKPVDRTWFRRMMSSRNTYALCLSQFCFGVAGFVFFSWFYTYLIEQRQVASTQAAQIQSAAYIAMAVGAALGGWLSDRATRRFGTRWGRRTVPAAALTLAGACGITAPTITNTALAGLVFAMAAGLLYAAAPCFWSIVIDIAGRGAGLLGGIQDGAGWLGTAVGTSSAPILVALLQSCGVICSWEVVLQLAGAMGLIGGCACLFIDASRPIDCAA